MMKQSVKVALLASFCCALWGSAFPFVKVGYALQHIEAQSTASQILYAGLRFLAAGIIAFAGLWKIAPRECIPKREAWSAIALIGLFQTVLQYLFFYIGVAHTTGVKASIIAGSNVFMALFVARFVFRLERLTKAKMIGTLIGFMGIIVINVDFSSFDLHMTLLGEGFIILTTLSYAFSSALMKRYSQYHTPLVLVTYQFIFGGGVMIAVGLIFGGATGPFSLKSAGVLLYLSAVSAVAYGIWSYLLKRNPVSSVAVYGFTNPIFGVMFSAFLLGEYAQLMNVKTAISLLLVSLGIYIVNMRQSPMRESEKV